MFLRAKFTPAWMSFALSAATAYPLGVDCHALYMPVDWVAPACSSRYHGFVNLAGTAAPGLRLAHGCVGRMSRPPTWRRSSSHACFPGQAEAVGVAGAAAALVAGSAAAAAAPAVAPAAKPRKVRRRRCGVSVMPRAYQGSPLASIGRDG